jgi:hypothetical protein
VKSVRDDNNIKELARGAEAPLYLNMGRTRDDLLRHSEKARDENSSAD